MPRLPRWTKTLSVSLLSALLLACGAEADGPSLERDAFIATYVDLRAEAILSDSAEISDEQRTQILDEHGVTEEELLAFTDYHGRDVLYMRELWDEVEERLDELRPVIDEGGDLVRPVQRPSDRYREGN